VAGPLAWKDTRDGYSFFQGPPESVLITNGARLTLEGSTMQREPAGVAPIEGSEGP